MGCQTIFKGKNLNNEIHFLGAELLCSSISEVESYLLEYLGSFFVYSAQIDNFTGNDLFLVETIFITKDCLRDWNVVPKPNMANLMYGGRNLKAASNIIFR